MTSKNQKIAEKIADELFRNGQGHEADRLVLMQELTQPVRNLGGWNKKAATDRIEATLDAAAPSIDVAGDAIKGEPTLSHLLDWLRHRARVAFGMSQEMALSPDRRTMAGEYEQMYARAAQWIGLILATPSSTRDESKDFQRSMTQAAREIRRLEKLLVADPDGKFAGGLETAAKVAESAHWTDVGNVGKNIAALVRNLITEEGKGGE